MRRELFEDVVEPSIQVGPHAWYSLPLSVVSHAAVVAILVAVPLTATNALPTPGLFGYIDNSRTALNVGKPGATQLSTPPPIAPSGPIPVGGAVREPKKLHHVDPVYPAMARAARLEGTVILEATIATDGRVTDVRVLRSNEMFDRAAIEAVRQWRFTTPTLNGIPVAATMTVTVRFTRY